MIRTYCDKLFRNSAETQSWFVRLCVKYGTMKVLQILILGTMERKVDRFEI